MRKVKSDGNSDGRIVKDDNLSNPPALSLDALQGNRLRFGFNHMTPELLKKFLEADPKITEIIFYTNEERMQEFDQALKEAAKDFKSEVIDTLDLPGVEGSTLKIKISKDMFPNLKDNG